MKSGEYYAEMIAAQSERTVKRLAVIAALEAVALIVALKHLLK